MSRIEIDETRLIDDIRAIDDATAALLLRPIRDVPLTDLSRPLEDAVNRYTETSAGLGREFAPQVGQDDEVTTQWLSLAALDFEIATRIGVAADVREGDREPDTIYRVDGPVTNYELEDRYRDQDEDGRSDFARWQSAGVLDAARLAEPLASSPLIGAVAGRNWPPPAQLAGWPPPAPPPPGAKTIQPVVKSVVDQGGKLARQLAGRAIFGPLSGIATAHLEGAAKALAGGLPPGLVETLGRVRQCAARLLKLVAAKLSDVFSGVPGLFTLVPGVMADAAGKGADELGSLIIDRLVDGQGWISEIDPILIKRTNPADAVLVASETAKHTWKRTGWAIEWIGIKILFPASAGASLALAGVPLWAAILVFLCVAVLGLVYARLNSVRVAVSSYP